MMRLLAFTFAMSAFGAMGAVAFDQADVDSFLATNACEGCDLSNASLEALAGRDATGAKLAGADISGNFIRQQTLDRADMTRATIVNPFFLESSAIVAVFVDADMTDVGMDNVVMREADFIGATLAGANIVNTNLRLANFAGADLTGARLVGAVLSGGDLTGANLSGATLDRTGVADADFTDANLAGATIVRMSLSDAILCRTTMPDGTLNNDGCV